MTSNPTIFQKAIAETDLYDGSIRTLSGRGVSGAALFEASRSKTCAPPRTSSARVRPHQG
jgi:transaldolase